jgi:hypothetical protein
MSFWKPLPYATVARRCSHSRSIVSSVDPAPILTMQRQMCNLRKQRSYLHRIRAHMRTHALPRTSLQACRPYTATRTRWNTLARPVRKPCFLKREIDGMALRVTYRNAGACDEADSLFGGDEFVVWGCCWEAGINQDHCPSALVSSMGAGVGAAPVLLWTMLCLRHQMSL